MELISVLQEQLKNRFVANKVIKAITNDVKLKTKELILKKYKDEILLKYGLEFELFDVKVFFSYYESDDLSIKKIEATLIYCCISKLPKHKREKLEEAKKIFSEHQYMPYSNYDIPIWEELKYDLDLKNILKEEINLKIE